MNDKHWNMIPSRQKALMIAKRQLAELVFDAVNLEGINFTLPEIQTLLDGITVGGHKLSDQQIALNQRDAWLQVFAWVERDDFAVSKQRVCQLHAIAAKEEALAWGRFRNGEVYIAGTEYIPPSCDDLDSLFERLVTELHHIDDPYDCAIHIFLFMARCQFFFDVNKRMGRFMMNGYLLNLGYPAINLPAKRQLEFNEKMLAFYDSGDEEEMKRFMRSCLSDKIVNIMG